MILLGIAFILPLCAARSKNVTCKMDRSVIYSRRHLLTCNIQKQTIDQRRIFIVPPFNSSVEAFLAISNKHAVFFPENLSKSFPRLKVVIFSRCGMKSVNNTFAFSEKLNLLDLSRNKITSVAEDSFINLVNLTELHLSYNQIRNLSVHTFVAQRNLQLLTLKGNQLQSLGDDTLANLHNLRNISLDNNKFVHFPQFLFRHNNKLEYIWLQENKIKTLSPVTFSFLPNLKFIDLRKNSCINKIYWRQSFRDLNNDLRRCSRRYMAEEILVEAFLRNFDVMTT